MLDKTLLNDSFFNSLMAELAAIDASYQAIVKENEKSLKFLKDCKQRAIESN